MSNWKATAYLLELRFHYESLSTKLFAENFPGLILCLCAENLTRNCCFCLGFGNSILLLVVVFAAVNVIHLADDKVLIPYGTALTPTALPVFFFLPFS